MDNFTRKWQKFHEGSLSKKEAVEFLHFLESDLGKAKFESLLTKIWTDQGRINPQESSPLSNPSSSLNSKKDNFFKKFTSYDISRIGTLFKYAACLLAFFLLLKNIDLLPNFSINTTNEGSETVWVTKSNPKGVKSRILLPDGTRVYLNAESQIKYSNNFIKNRFVILDGEAFFDVIEDKNHPFIVEASHIKTTVLGTSFNVNSHYPESVEIGLATGALKVTNSATGKELLLAPGEASRVVDDNSKMEKYKVDPEQIAQWRKGVLFINNEKFDRVIKKLENWYGVHITVIGDRPTGTCSGTFEKNAYLSNVLNVLAHALNFSYEIDKKQVTINTNNDR
tara:strand:+ start:319 stop:1332 length:1014 start_codon:yes stop_codon:yes gene_type:complete